MQNTPNAIMALMQLVPQPASPNVLTRGTKTFLKRFSVWEISAADQLPEGAVYRISSAAAASLKP